MFRGYVVNSYHHDRFMGIAIPWFFETKEAAQYWIDNFNPSPMFNYKISEMSVYSLDTLKRLKGD